MKILIATDAWRPQVNGVVRTLEMTAGELGRMGHEVRFVTPEGLFTVPCPTYADIRLSLKPTRPVTRALDEFVPDAIHVATEGPIGLAMRRACGRRKLGFTTAYHTRFPDYLNARLGLPKSWIYRYVRWFHAASAAVMVTTASVETDLVANGITHLRRWSRGVDMDLFSPARRGKAKFDGPVFLYVGRVATEKNLEAFLKLDLPGTKLVVGDGPERPTLQRAFPDARFLGAKHGAELADIYADADVFVFPSRTDTFGLVLLEALASGLPVAAYPVPGPLDVIGPRAVGCLDEDLGAAALKCLDIDRNACRAHAETYSWARSAGQFLDNLVLAVDATRPVLLRRRAVPI